MAGEAIFLDQQRGNITKNLRIGISYYLHLLRQLLLFKPVNPLNTPDEFEKESLTRFEKDVLLSSIGFTSIELKPGVFALATLLAIRDWRTDNHFD